MDDLPKTAVHNGIKMNLIYQIEYKDTIKVHYESSDGQFYWSHYCDLKNEFTKTNIA